MFGRRNHCNPPITGIIMGRVGVGAGAGAGVGPVGGTADIRSITGVIIMAAFMGMFIVVRVVAVFTEKAEAVFMEKEEADSMEEGEAADTDAKMETSNIERRTSNGRFQPFDRLTTAI